jgi:AraC family transcriptional regulator of adaptative response/methylated-DNA-[protein]-cysteine methyltransferase
MARTIIQRVSESGSSSSSSISAFRFSPYANARLFASQKKGSISNTCITKAGSSSDTISYSLGLCIYGPLLVAQTDKGVCAVLLGNQKDGASTLRADLFRRFPQTHLREASDLRAQAQMDALCQHLKDPTVQHAIPLDLKGSPFQLLVWKALLQVTQGTTETSTQLARRAKLPASSARAVANACGQNHVAFLVPCHRIVRTDGQMGGYRWGSQTKEKMLELERSQGAQSSPSG